MVTYSIHENGKNTKKFYIDIRLETNKPSANKWMFIPGDANDEGDFSSVEEAEEFIRDFCKKYKYVEPDMYNGN